MFCKSVPPRLLRGELGCFSSFGTSSLLFFSRPLGVYSESCLRTCCPLSQGLLISFLGLDKQCCASTWLTCEPTKVKSSRGVQGRKQALLNWLEECSLLFFANQEPALFNLEIIPIGVGCLTGQHVCGRSKAQAAGILMPGSVSYSLIHSPCQPKACKATERVCTTCMLQAGWRPDSPGPGEVSKETQRAFGPLRPVPDI